MKVSFSIQTANPDPFRQFELWYKERLAGDIQIPNTMSLGTASAEGVVAVRTVLLKDFNEKGFVFFSNYMSRKGQHFETNPSAALLFYWPETERQVRIEGSVQKVSEKDSDLYFNSRPQESRISAWASEQSSVIPDRLHLETRFEFYRNKFLNKHIDRPPHWGGYRLVPKYFEFWQEGKHRLHDRITYSLYSDDWLISQLAP
jgi:pyridoxamine 5'-phosphate oxidase